MYKHNAKQLLLPHEFFMPFEGQLNPENRWCKLAGMIPWETAEERYIESLRNPNAGQRAYPLVSNYVRNFHRVSKWFKPPGGSPEFVQG